MYIRGIKKKFYDKVINQITVNSNVNIPFSKIRSVPLDFNGHKYILKFFFDNPNRIVALEGVEYDYNSVSKSYQVKEVTKNNILCAMTEMLINQYI